MQQKLAEMELRVRELDSGNQELQTELQSRVSQHATETESLRQTITHLQAQVTSLEGQVRYTISSRDLH